MKKRVMKKVLRNPLRYRYTSLCKAIRRWDRVFFRRLKLALTLSLTEPGRCGVVDGIK